MATLAHIWRHPIKGIGAETLETVQLTPNRPLPMDRAWAVLESGRTATNGWQSCRNFLRGAKGPSLMAITATLNGDNLHLKHPELPQLAFRPGIDPQEKLFDWLRPIYPDDRAAPDELVQAPEEGMADADFASVSILNVSSLRALSQRVGVEMDMRRFRGNLWLDGLAPWEEFDLIDTTLTIGEAQLKVVDRISRCRATEANPDTGQRDVDTLKHLKEGWSHTDFGVIAKVINAGEITVNDRVEVN